jgi:hypothetical protein
VDPGGAGSVHLVAAGFALAALTVWSTRRTATISETLPPAHQPLLAVVGALLILGGGVGWQMANPLQVETMGALGMVRSSVSLVLASAGGLLFPLLYTWFVTGSSEPTLTARGFAAGFVAGLACGPFVQPGIAFVIGLLAGATVPFVTYLLDGRLRLQDRTGVLVSSGVPALIGLLLVGVFADGLAGNGWQATGTGTYLGVSGQGVSGILVSNGFQADFPGQIQAQIIGVIALGLWGFLAGLIVCVPLGLLFHALLTHEEPVAAQQALQPAMQPAMRPNWREGNAATTTVDSLPAVAGASYRSADAYPQAPAYQQPAEQWPADAAAVYAAQPMAPAEQPLPPTPPAEQPAEQPALWQPETVANVWDAPSASPVPAAAPPTPPAPASYTPPPVGEGTAPTASERSYVAQSYDAQPHHADAYQEMEGEQSPSAGSLLDAALDNGASAEAQNGVPQTDSTETQLVSVVGSSPLTRRRRPLPPPAAPPRDNAPHG